MKKYLVRILAVIVLITSIAVMTGWVLDIAALKSILPQWVTMKFSTALSFFFGGVILYSLDKSFRDEAGFSEVLLPISSLIILLLMISLLASVLFGISTGIEDLFVKEAQGAVATAAPGQPSIGTMFSFILIALTGITVMTKSPRIYLYTSISGWLVVTMGALALLGYMLGIPVLYYAIEGMSSAMAVHTAILFLLIGIGLVLLGKTESVTENATESVAESVAEEIPTEKPTL